MASSIDRQLASFRALSEKQIKAAAARALNKAATATRNEIPKIIRETSGLPVSVVKDAVQIVKADKGENLSTMRAVLRVSLQRIPLVLFGARERAVRTARGPRKGVTVKVGGQRKAWASAFLATMKSGHTGVYKRKGDDRLPIKELMGPSAAHLLGYTAQGFSNSFGRISEVMAYGHRVFVREFQAELERALGKKIKLLEKRKAG